jgi:hypothetical protein
MKNFLFTLFLYLTLNFTYGQIKIDNSLIKPNNGDDYVSVQILIKNLKKSKIDSNSFDTLYISDYKKANRNFYFFTFDISFDVVGYSKRNNPDFTFVGDLSSTLVENNCVTFDYTNEKDTKISVKIITLENDKFGVIITETNSKGKTNIFFSNDCKLKKLSV